ncbi:MAG: hypothetical protein QMC81_08730 [Thermoanaerobacterales bacterium]|nr:hypothetical protein [Thermoanaerobacterales bacterium]
MTIVLYVLIFPVLAAGLFILGGRLAFGRMLAASVRDLIADAQTAAPAAKFSYADLQGLPAPVQRYFRHVLPEGQEEVRFVRLKQEGQMRTSEKQKWMPFTAEQYFAIRRPGFIWHSVVRPVPGVWIEGRDMYRRGEGHMLIKLFSAIPVVNAKGREMDEGALHRYLLETVWFPTALLPSERIKWEAVDKDAARVTITDGELTLSAVAHFNAREELTRWETMRYNFDAQKRIKYTGYCNDYRRMDGMLVPRSVVVQWNYPDHDFTYFKGTVTEIEYDRPALQMISNRTVQRG